MRRFAQFAGGAAERLRPAPRPARRPDPRREGYALCPADGFWFRPAYTDGACPLCGEGVPGGAPPPPLVARLGGAWLGWAALALVPVGMTALVLVMWFAG